MNLESLHTLERVVPEQWNALVGDYPFLRHEFLVALERHDAVGRIAAAAPTFVKLNSWGEFVFDFAWADAYARNGLRYYPKLVAAAPYTPATGPRVLVAPDRDPAATAAELLRGARALALERRWSGVHWLFPREPDLQWLRADGLLIRSDVQYHWHNAGYADFDDFLAALNSRKRKKARRERRRVAEQGVTLTRHRGDRMDARQWALAHGFYAATFEKKWTTGAARSPPPSCSRAAAASTGVTGAANATITACTSRPATIRESTTQSNRA